MKRFSSVVTSSLMALTLAASGCQEADSMDATEDDGMGVGGGKADDAAAAPSGWNVPDEVGLEEAFEIGLDADYELVMEVAIAEGFVAPHTNACDVGDTWDGECCVTASDEFYDCIDTETEAATFGGTMTAFAITAGITSQADTPAPGPADVVALGILVVGLAAATGVGILNFARNRNKEVVCRCKFEGDNDMRIANGGPCPDITMGRGSNRRLCISAANATAPAVCKAPPNRYKHCQAI